MVLFDPDDENHSLWNTLLLGGTVALLSGLYLNINPPQNQKSMVGKCVVITGATSGIGAATYTGQDMLLVVL